MSNKTFMPEDGSFPLNGYNAFHQEYSQESSKKYSGEYHTDSISETEPDFIPDFVKETYNKPDFPLSRKSISSTAKSASERLFSNGKTGFGYQNINKVSHLYFPPEGLMYETSPFYEREDLENLIVTGKTAEARCVVATREHNLIVELGCMKGVISREEGALGISEGKTKEVALISRVGKTVCFKVLGFTEGLYGEEVAVLSRIAAQKECIEKYISKLVPGDIIKAKISKIDTFGAFADIGCGICSLIPIDFLSVSRVSSPADRFEPGQDVFVAVKSIEESENLAGGKITLTHKELLGTWEENAAKFRIGETVRGIVRSIENYGVFIEIAPNLAGLAESYAGLEINQPVSVYIKSMNPLKMKLKLVVVESFAVNSPDRLKDGKSYSYFFTDGHIERWNYSPKDSEKMIETVF